MKYAFMRDHKDEFEVGTVCEVLRASRSGFYYWLSRDPVAKDEKLEALNEVT